MSTRRICCLWHIMGVDHFVGNLGCLASSWLCMLTWLSRAALLLLSIALSIVRNLWGIEDDPDKIFAGWGKPGTGTGSLAWYPTDFLRDVVPVPCHSHNDYWRKVPVFSALHMGCTGIEADVVSIISYLQPTLSNSRNAQRAPIIGANCIGSLSIAGSNLESH